MKVLKHLWVYYFLLLFVLIFLLFYPFFLVLLSNKKWYKSAHKLRRVWGYCLMFLTGLIPKTTYECFIDKKGTYVFVGNHFSYLDILSVNTFMPFYFSFMAKAELAKIPLFKIFFRTIDIPVNRKSKQDSALAYQEAKDRLQNGNSILIFPEGGIGPNVPEFLPFKPGAFRMAIETQCPIVPITIADNYRRLFSGGERGGTPGRMRMHIHKPISTVGLDSSDVTALSNKVFCIIEAQFKKMNNDH